MTDGRSLGRYRADAFLVLVRGIDSQQLLLIDISAERGPGGRQRRHE